MSAAFILGSSMEYHESPAQSAEILRLALPLMSRQAAALHPISYAVWYEYVAGINPGIKAAIDELTRDGSLLDEIATTALFRKYIAEIDEQDAQQVAVGFKRVLEDMSLSAAQAGDDAHRFGNALVQLTEELDGFPDGQQLDSGIIKLLADTRGMQSSITQLNERLDDSRREIERLRQEVHRAREDALQDALTGLTNRKGFDLALAACLAKNEPGSAGPSLLLTDIDHFKRFNDSFGHLFGDKVIRAIAKILKDNVKGKDTAARYGGEEFVILLPETPLEGARSLAEKIRQMVEASRVKRTDSNETVARVTVSLGVACYRAGESASEFVERADRALYDSKNLGRNRVSLADRTAAV